MESSTPCFPLMMRTPAMSQQTSRSPDKTDYQEYREERARLWLPPLELVLEMCTRVAQFITTTHWEARFLFLLLHSWHSCTFVRIRIFCWTDLHCQLYAGTSKRNILCVWLQYLVGFYKCSGCLSTLFQYYYYMLYKRMVIYLHSMLAIIMFCTLWTDKYLYISVVYVVLSMEWNLCDLGVCMSCVHIWHKLFALNSKYKAFVHFYLAHLRKIFIKVLFTS